MCNESNSIYEIMNAIDDTYSVSKKEIPNKLPLIEDNVKHVNSSNTLEANLKYIADIEDVTPINITLPISKLISHQPTVTLEKIKSIQSNIEVLSKPVNVYKVSNLYILTDGNHRVNARLLNGYRVVAAKLYDLDAVNTNNIRNFIQELKNEYTLR